MAPGETENDAEKRDNKNTEKRAGITEDRKGIARVRMGPKTLNVLPTLHHTLISAGFSMSARV